jgi:hypothetical protein
MRSTGCAGCSARSAVSTICNVHRDAAPTGDCVPRAADSDAMPWCSCGCTAPRRRAPPGSSGSCTADRGCVSRFTAPRSAVVRRRGPPVGSHREPRSGRAALPLESLGEPEGLRAPSPRDPGLVVVTCFHHLAQGEKRSAGSPVVAGLRPSGWAGGATAPWMRSGLRHGGPLGGDPEPHLNTGPGRRRGLLLPLRRGVVKLTWNVWDVVAGAAPKKCQSGTTVPVPGRGRVVGAPAQPAMDPFAGCSMH